jgi:hypothetical protein
LGDPATQSECRNEQRGGHDGHVLQQEDAERVAAVHGIDLLAAGQHPQHGGGAAHGNDRPNGQRGGNVQAQHPAEQSRGRTGEQDLQRAAPRGDGAHGAQPPPGELQTDSEQE